MYSNLSLCKFTLHFTAIPLVWSIIYLVTSSYTYYIYLNDQALSSIPKIKMIISIIFYLCSSMTLICHTFCIYNDPGTLDYSRVEKLNDDQKEFCKKCNKPPIEIVIAKANTVPIIIENASLKEITI